MKLSRLFVKKPIRVHEHESDDQGPTFKRHLKSGHLISIGIGAIIGAGIFVITGQAAAQYAGPAITISFIIAAFVCVLAGLCYAELSALIPVSGSSYSYSYIAMGEFPAWIVGWLLIAQYILLASTVAVGWSGYCVSFLRDFGFSISDSISGIPIVYNSGAGWGFSGAWINFPAIIIVLLAGMLISIGMRAASHFNNIMVVIKLTTIALFIVLGIAFIQPGHWVPFIPENTGIFGQFGFSGVLRAAGLLFFAYTGFDAVATLAQDAVNPQRDLPRGILGSLGIATVAYIITSLVLTGVVSYTKLNVPDPMSIALNAMGSGFFWLKSIVKLAILAGLASVVLVNLLGATRIFFAMSKDGLLPKSFSKISSKTGSTIASTWIASAIMVAIAGLLPVNLLGEVVSIVILLLFAIVCAGVLILRYTHPHDKRPFKVPFVPWVPALGILCCFAQIGILPMVAWLQLVLWLSLGTVLYFAYSRHHSKLGKKLSNAGLGN